MPETPWTAADAAVRECAGCGRGLGLEASPPSLLRGGRGQVETFDGFQCRACERIHCRTCSTKKLREACACGRHDWTVRRCRELSAGSGAVPAPEACWRLTKEEADAAKCSIVHALIYRTDGWAIGIAEAEVEFGRIHVMAAVLRESMRRRVHAVTSRGHPPYLFISYRWESDDLRQRVPAIARKVSALGYQPLLDQYESMRNWTEDVPRYVSAIANARYVGIVLTQSYLDAVRFAEPGGAGWWVREEFRLAQLAVEAGHLQAVVFVMDPDLSADDLGVDVVAELRPEASPEAWGAALPPCDGLRLEGAAEAELQKILDESWRLIEEGSHAAAENLLSSHATLAALPEVRVSLATTAARRGSCEAARPLAREVLEAEVEANLRIHASDVLALCADRPAAIRGFASVRGQNPRPGYVHHMIGALLLESGDPWAAEGHLAYSIYLDGDSMELDDRVVRLYRLAAARYRLGRFDDALDVLTDLLGRTRNASTGGVGAGHRLLAARGRVLCTVALGRRQDALAACADLHEFRGMPEIDRIVRSVELDQLEPRAYSSASSTELCCNECLTSYALLPSHRAICGTCASLVRGDLPRCPSCESPRAPEWELRADAPPSCQVCLRGELIERPGRRTGALRYGIPHYDDYPTLDELPVVTPTAYRTGQADARR